MFDIKTTLAATAIAVAGTAAMAESHGGMKTIVDIAAGDEQFSTLVAAVQAADLVDTLSSEGPFTVFAPTNDAFAALPEGTVEGLLEPAAKDDLVGVLTYHVVSGKIMSGDLAVGTQAVQTVQGDTLCVTLDGGVMLDDGTGSMANVVAADIEASNGVIHVIDKVILPGNGASCM